MSVGTLRLEFLTSAFNTVPSAYRSPWWGEVDRKLRKSFAGSSTAAILLLAIAFLIPQSDKTMETVEDVPERFAKLMVEPEPVPPAPVKSAAKETPVPPEKVAQPESAPEKVVPDPAPAPRRRQPDPKKPEAGVQGKKLAETQVAAQLSTATASLEKTLASVQTSLNNSTATKKARRSGRSSAGQPTAKGTGDLAAVDLGSAGGAAESWGSSVGSIEVVNTGGSGNGTGTMAGGRRRGAGGAGTGSGGLTDAQLLAVVRKHAAGIEYCFDRALKHDADLEGKMVASITVAPDGRVSNVRIVSDSVGSASMAECVTSQIKGWRFPKAQLSTTFQAPFVFSPQD